MHIESALLMADRTTEADEAKQLIRRCLDGDAVAATQFQRQFGELIYGYPMRVYRVSPDEAGDFYVFAFEGRRIFRRLRTFEGRAPLRAYLLGFVLDDLVLEWKRGPAEVETVPIDELGELAAGVPLAVAGTAAATTPGAASQEVVNRLDPGKAVLLKLLYIEDHELTPDDIGYLTRASRHEAAEVITAIGRLRATVQAREAALRGIEDRLDTVHAWTQLYERRLQRLADDLHAVPPTAVTAERLREERGQLERKLQRRHAQRTKLLLEAQRRKLTAPYKDIAALLGTTVGNVASQISRLRQDLRRLRGEAQD